MRRGRQGRSWTGGIALWRKMTIALAAAALASGIATYLALTGAPPFGPRPAVVLSLLNLDLVLLLLLATLVAKRLVEVWAERRRGLAGSRLQVRLVGLFSLIAVLPTIIVAVFMLGLGLGSLAGGALSTRSGLRSLRAFGIIELSIGAFGVASLPIFHQSRSLISPNAKERMISDVAWEPELPPELMMSGTKSASTTAFSSSP